LRVAVLSDIHGNLHALEAVLDEVDAEPVGAVWCLGDLVGYGPKPNACCRRLAGRADLCLVGNHDLGALGRLELAEFSPDAALAARWTAVVLEEEWRRFLASLEPRGAAGGAELYHGSPRDPVWEYVLTPEAALLAFRETPAELVLVGHSHVPLAISFDGERLEGGHAEGGAEVELAGGARWLLNPGSVGQPRDGDPRAAWLLLDLEMRTASFRRAEYDVERTQREIRERGLPEPLAARLAVGF
jgi:predicted phosphodiesterase